MPARVHEHDGVAVTFWEHVPPTDNALPAAGRLGAMLAELHAALRASRLALPRLAPADDIPRFAARAGAIGPEDRARIAAAYERLAAQLAPAADQPLHGDAHPGNLLPAADGGWRWCDFEDACAGPVHWDLASLRRSPRLDGAAAVRAYARAARRDDVDDAALAPWIALRELHLTVWYCLYSERLPALRPRAGELLARWRAGAAQPPSG